MVTKVEYIVGKGLAARRSSAGEGDFKWVITSERGALQVGASKGGYHGCRRGFWCWGWSVHGCGDRGGNGRGHGSWFWRRGRSWGRVKRFYNDIAALIHDGKVPTVTAAASLEHFVIGAGALNARANVGFIKGSHPVGVSAYDDFSIVGGVLVVAHGLEGVVGGNDGGSTGGCDVGSGNAKMRVESLELGTLVETV